MANFLTKSTLSDIGDIGGIQRDWMFRVHLFMPKLYRDVDRKIADNYEEFVSYKAKNFTLPNIKLVEKEINYLGYKKVIPVEYEQDDTIDILFEENDAKDIYSIFSDWIRFIRDGNYNESLPDNLMKAKLEIYTLNNEGLFHKKKFVFYDAIPNNLGGSEFNYSNNSNITYNITFKFSEFDEVLTSGVI